MKTKYIAIVVLAAAAALWLLGDTDLLTNNIPVPALVYVVPLLAAAAFYSSSIIMLLRCASPQVFGDALLRDSTSLRKELSRSSQSDEGVPALSALNTGGASTSSAMGWPDKNAILTRESSIEPFGQNLLVYGIFEHISGERLEGVSGELFDQFLRSQYSGWLPKRGRVSISLLHSLVEGEDSVDYVTRQNRLLTRFSTIVSSLREAARGGQRTRVEQAKTAMRLGKRRSAREKGTAFLVPDTVGEQAEATELERERRT